MLVGAIAANVYANNLPEERTGAFPYIGATVIGILLLLTPWRRPDWSIVPEAARAACSCSSLVLSASMMPVEDLPPASAQSTFGLGFVSAVFDNIPLTKLALEQGGYDWGALAYAVGFGGSMIWFGSSAGVAVSNLFPEAKSVGQWLRQGWYVAVGYVVGFLVLILIAGWNPARGLNSDARALTSRNSASTQWNATGIAPSRQNSAPFAKTLRPSRTAITPRYRYAARSQRAGGARIRRREAAGAHAPVPGHHRHDHEQGDLRRQQQVVRQQARVPGVHRRQPGGREQHDFELADDPRGEQRDAAPQEDRGAATAAGHRCRHAMSSLRWRYQSLWNTSPGSIACLAARNSRMRGCAASTCARCAKRW